MSTMSRRPSAAMIVAVIALVAALTGGAYAATKIGTEQIKPGAVTKKKLHSQSVSTQKLVPSERSQGFVFNDPSAVPLAGNASTTVATLNLPTGANFVVTAAASLGNNTNALNLASCELRDDGVKVTAGNGTCRPRRSSGDDHADRDLERRRRQPRLPARSHRAGPRPGDHRGPGRIAGSDPADPVGG